MGRITFGGIKPTLAQVCPSGTPERQDPSGELDLLLYCFATFAPRRTALRRLGVAREWVRTVKKKSAPKWCPIGP